MSDEVSWWTHKFHYLRIHGKLFLSVARRSSKEEIWRRSSKPMWFPQLEKRTQGKVRNKQTSQWGIGIVFVYFFYFEFKVALLSVGFIANTQIVWIYTATGTCQWDFCSNELLPSLWSGKWNIHIFKVIVQSWWSILPNMISASLA